MVTLATESFTAADLSPFPAAFSTASSNSAAKIDIINNQGRMAGPTSNLSALRDKDIPARSDHGVTGTLILANAATQYANGNYYLWLAADALPGLAPANGYGIIFYVTNGVIIATEFTRRNANAAANIGAYQSTTAIPAAFKYRFETVSGSVRFRFWAPGDPEPTTWFRVVSDPSTPPAAGFPGRSSRPNSSVGLDWRFDDEEYYDFTTATTTPPPSSTTTSAIGETVYAAEPSTASGLTAIKGDGTDESVALQAALNYAKSTFGGGRVILPFNKTVKFGTGVTVPKGVRLIGDATSVLNYTNTAGIAITVNDGSATPLVGFKLTGPGRTGNTATAIDITGARLTFKELEVRNFYRILDYVNNDTYILDFQSCRFGNADTIVFGDVANKLATTGGGASNSGERILFNDCLFDNSRELAYASENGPSIHYIGCSMDFITSYGTYWDLFVKFVGCHIESQGSTTPNYMIKGLGNPKISFSGCTILMGGSAGTYSIMDPANPPYNLTNGRVSASDTVFYWPGYNGQGAGNAWNRQVFTQPLGSATSRVITSPWVSEWSQPSVRYVANGAHPVPNVAAPRISALSASNHTITIELPDLAAEALFEIVW